MWKMTLRFGKEKKFFRDLGNGQNIWEMAQVHGTQL